MAARPAQPVQALLIDLDGSLIEHMPLQHQAWRARLQLS